MWCGSWVSKHHVLFQNNFVLLIEQITFLVKDFRKFTYHVFALLLLLVPSRCDFDYPRSTVLIVCIPWNLLHFSIILPLFSF